MSNFNYLKTAELATYVKRGGEITEGDELYWIRAASRLLDGHCRMALAISDYSKTIRLSRNTVGYIREKPIIKITPQNTTTGVRLRPLGRDTDTSRVSLSAWFDVDIPTDLENLINKKTGRFEVNYFFRTDYERFANGAPLKSGWGTYEYEAVVEFSAGHFVNTRLTSGALITATTVTVDSTTGIVENQTYLTLGDAAAEYKVTDINGSVLTITPGLAAAQASGTGVYGAVPDDVKCACAMIIEDRLTYEPNTKRQHSKLDVLTDIFERSTLDPIPVDAIRLLDKYKIR
jgi:hypothetical protein